MAEEVDLIIDIDGGIVHNYLPKNFKKERYIIWRISCVIPETQRPWIKRNFKMKLKGSIKRFLGDSECIPSRNHKIYGLLRN